MVNSNLVPVQRTDKNGRTVIRHMKPKTQPSRHGLGVPAPSLHTQMELLRSKASDLQALADSRGLKMPVNFMDFIYGSDNNREHLDNLYNLTMRFPEDQRGVLLEEVVELIGIKDDEAVRILLGQADYLVDNPQSADHIVFMHRALLKNGIDPDPETGRFDTLPVHLDAELHYTPQYRAQHGYSFILHYRSNPVYMAAVERHADRLHELMAYRSIRGITVEGEHHNKVDLFDEQDFLDYLSHGPLGDGTL